MREAVCGAAAARLQSTPITPSQNSGAAAQNAANIFLPGDLLECEYELAATELDWIEAVETSVLWQTLGKGDEDIGVHFFNRRSRQQLRQAESLIYRFETVMPPSPYSYEGVNLKIRWCARVRCLGRRPEAGRATEIIVEQPFSLGQASARVQRTAESPPTTAGAEEAAALAGPANLKQG